MQENENICPQNHTSLFITILFIRVKKKQKQKTTTYSTNCRPERFWWIHSMKNNAVTKMNKLLKHTVYKSLKHHIGLKKQFTKGKGLTRKRKVRIL